MRLLVVAPFLPDSAAAHGGGLYLGTLCEALARRAEIGLVAQLRPAEMARLPEVAGVFARHWAVPHDRPGGPRRLLHQASMLLRWGPGGEPLLVAKHRSRGMASALDRAVAEFAPDAALVELAHTAQYLPHLRSVPTVLTDHEAGVPANAHTGLGAWADRRDTRLWRAFVLRTFGSADLVQAVTEEDAAQLSAMLGRPVLLRLPVLHVPAQPAAKTNTPPRVLFVGNYRHGPNPEAAAVVARQVLPRLLQQLPGTELWLAGPHPERLDQLRSLPGVRVLGYVPDLAGLFAQVRLLLAPIYSGGGFRVKTLSALAHGVPVVTNSLGARGAAVPAPARVVANDIDGLCQATAALLADPVHAAAAGRAAHAWARANLAPDAVARTQIERVRELLELRRR